jgi:two-component system, OmpR family, response regulator SaeR
VPSEGKRQVVLVVDDEPAILLLCRVNLELGGYEVREAGTLGDALGRVEEGVDIVLLDMHIGIENGETLLEELVRREIPVAVVTGSTDLESVSNKGANAVLAKPFTIEDLETTVARLAALNVSHL